MASEAAAAVASIISNNPCCLFAPPPPGLTNNYQPPPPPPPCHQEPASEPQQLPLPPPAKKKRNLPGTPDPDAEVIALSPRTLLATNRFVCEMCGKGFQRDQNLQLHRRGHNLPWKLRQKTCARKRVYVCPETTCVHHNPSRALGDLTGIKKHFCRKHGDKKWKCDKCSKRYAVQSDWKAHAKTCGTREYRCDCGTLFSRRDSFITHRAFCDALAEETARLTSSYLFAAGSPPGLPALRPNPNPNMMLPPVVPATHLKAQPLAPHHVVGGLSLWGGDGDALPPMPMVGAAATGILLPGAPALPPQLYADLFAPPQLGLGWICGNASELTSAASSAAASSGKLRLQDADSVPSLFSGQQHAKPAAPAADMSATALLQKAAQMGAVTSASGSAHAIMSVACLLEPPEIDDIVGAHHQSSDDAAGGLLFSASSQHKAPNNPRGSPAPTNTLIMSQLTAAARNMPYDDVLSAVRHAGLKDATVAVGRDETRDFLGVGVQTLCSSSLNDWI